MTQDAYTLDEIHEEIAEVYRWWARSAPGVTPREEGRLGALWSLASILTDEARAELTPEAALYEFGRP